MAQVEFVVKLLDYWKKNGIPYKSVLNREVNFKLRNTDITLPTDFQELYKNINGNIDCDQNGFWFYGWEDLTTMGKRFALKKSDRLYNVVIFIDYMQASWWYGIDIKGNNYEIGIIANEKRFKSITNSLERFVDLYIDDSEILYDYGGFIRPVS